ncbi:MAG TPA: cytochrome c oxidase assembly protein, partial [Solirubrobacteraceae bacterium]|nr:cytochrome c oxidase assembly protein [Solirubrobacteraceae bacterium]
AAALGPPLDGAADGSLTAHMAQHLLLGLAAPALLALAAPVRLALAALPSGGRRAVGRALHHPLVRAAARPAAAVPLAAAVTAGVHAPGAVDLALRHDAVHVLEHGALFWSGLLLWMSVLAVDPLPAAPGPVARLAWLMLLMTAMSVVGAAYASAGRVLVGAYAQRPGALADQQAAGALMWVGGAALLVPVILAVVFAALLGEEERQRRREAAQAGGRG